MTGSKPTKKQSDGNRVNTVRYRNLDSVLKVNCESGLSIKGIAILYLLGDYDACVYIYAHTMYHCYI